MSHFLEDESYTEPAQQQSPTSHHSYSSGSASSRLPGTRYYSSAPSSASQNSRNDRLQQRIKDLARSNERDGGGKSLGARTKVIRRTGMPSANFGTTDGPPPTFRGGVVGDAAEVDSTRSSSTRSSKRVRLTAPPRWNSDRGDVEPHLVLVRDSTPTGSGRTKVHTRDSRLPGRDNIGPNHPSPLVGRSHSPPPQWLSSILAEDTRSPSPLDAAAHSAASSPYSTLDSTPSTDHRRSRLREHSPSLLPPSPFSFPAPLSDSVPLGGRTSAPPRPFFEAQLARAPSVQSIRTIPEEEPTIDTSIRSGFHLQHTNEGDFMYRHSPSVDLPRSRFSTPVDPHATNRHISPLGDFGQLYDQLNRDVLIRSLGIDEEPMLSSSPIGSHHTPSIFSSESDRENRSIEDFWKRPNAHASRLSSERAPDHFRDSSTDRYAASLAQAARDRFLTPISTPTLTPPNRAPLTDRTIDLSISTSEGFGDEPPREVNEPYKTPPPAGIYRENYQEQPYASVVSDFVVEPPLAEMRARASSAPPIFTVNDENVNQLHSLQLAPARQNYDMDKGHVESEDDEMKDISEVESFGEDRSTDGDSIFPSTTVAGRTDWTSEVDEGEEALLKMQIVEEGEVDWSFWENDALSEG